jgi:hypothetical protein
MRKIPRTKGLYARIRRWSTVQRIVANELRLKTRSGRDMKGANNAPTSRWASLAGGRIWSAARVAGAT